MAKAEFKLTQIRRQALDSPIIRLSIDIREGRRIPYGKYGDGVFKIDHNEVTSGMLVKSDQLLCGMNRTRTLLNRRVRKLKGFNNKMMPEVGEKLIGLTNLPNKGMFNGQIWTSQADYSEFTLETSHRTVMQIENEAGKKAIQQCWFPEDIKMNSFSTKAQLGRFMKENNIYSVDFGYALTVHKSQGDSYKRPIIFEEFLGNAENHKKWLYTAVTRASEKVFIVA